LVWQVANTKIGAEMDFVLDSCANYCTEKLQPYGLPSELCNFQARPYIFHITYKAPRQRGERSRASLREHLLSVLPLC